MTLLFKLLMGEEEPDSGEIKWGVSTTQGYMPTDNSAYFEGCELSIMDWMRQFSEDKRESYLRTFLGRMLFSGDEVYKPVNVLSGGERVRCMISKLMLSGASVLLLDQPTNHLDQMCIRDSFMMPSPVSKTVPSKSKSINLYMRLTSPRELYPAPGALSIARRAA